MADNPIQDVITALSPIIAPTADGTGTPTETPLFATIQTLVQAIFNASSDLKTVSGDIKSALTSAATVMTAIGSAVKTSTGSLADVGGVMSGLQNTLSMLQSLAPAGTAVVFNSASSLFQTIQQQLNALVSQAGADMTTAATEIAQLAQIMTALVTLFP
jgi:hypothetical protein